MHSVNNSPTATIATVVLMAVLIAWTRLIPWSKRRWARRRRDRTNE
jgi:hypothetical protein